jgi:hypothetical protein
LILAIVQVAGEKPAFDACLGAGMTGAYRRDVMIMIRVKVEHDFLAQLIDAELKLAPVQPGPK